MSMPTPLLEPGFEIVHFMLSYYDGILEGVADCRGAPHHFQLEDRGAPDEPRDRYRLTHLSPEAFAAFVDGWNIWCRWEAAYRAGRVAPHLGPNPALPGDLSRQREADVVVTAWISAARPTSFCALGEFKPLLQNVNAGTARGALQVLWTLE
jgi:hypothetical protein